LTYVILLCSALSRFVNKAADGGITALHMVALNGYFDCVQLLLDIHANVSSETFHYGTTMDLIGLLFCSMPHNLFANLSFVICTPENIIMSMRRGWKHPLALCCLWGQFKMLSGKNNIQQEEACLSCL
jgi:hypothetical protein